MKVGALFLNRQKAPKQDPVHDGGFGKYGAGCANPKSLKSLGQNHENHGVLENDRGGSVHDSEDAPRKSQHAC